MRFLLALAFLVSTPVGGSRPVSAADGGPPLIVAQMPIGDRLRMGSQAQARSRNQVRRQAPQATVRPDTARRRGAPPPASAPAPLPDIHSRY